MIQVYKGDQTAYRITGLTGRSEWQVRVCAIRQCEDGAMELSGAYSPGVTFNTSSPKQPQVSGAVAATAVSRVERKPLSDQQWAFILLLGFTVCAVLLALLAQRIIAYTAANSTAPTQ